MSKVIYTLTGLAMALAATSAYAAIEKQSLIIPALPSIVGEAAISFSQAPRSDRFQLARRGADDPAGDDRGRHRGRNGGRGRGGHDDPPGHA